MYISVLKMQRSQLLVFLGKGNLFVIYVRSSVWCFYVNVVELTQCDHDALSPGRLQIHYIVGYFQCNT